MHFFETNIKLYQTDAAGLLFFSRLFEIAHDAFQDLLENAQLNLSEILKNSHFLIPVVHAEADYQMPLQVGDKIEVKIIVEKISQSSYTLFYDILKNHQMAGWVKTIHVSIDKRTGEKIFIPKRLRNVLAPHLKDASS